MARPHRPNPTPKSEPREKRRLTRVRQETRAEMKTRKRAEAFARCAENRGHQFSSRTLVKVQYTSCASCGAPRSAS
jgi:hypothetical protein